jgi:hypothetical protein
VNVGLLVYQKKRDACGVKLHMHVGLKRKNLEISTLKSKKTSPSICSSKTFCEPNNDVKRRFD